MIYIVQKAENKSATLPRSLCGTITLLSVNMRVRCPATVANRRVSRWSTYLAFQPTVHMRMPLAPGRPASPGLTISDHLIVPCMIDSRYPYADTGMFPNSATGSIWEQLTFPSRTQLLTSVAVATHWDVIETAKPVPTIGTLSGGRFAPGSVADWMVEFKTIPGIALRRKQADEA